MFPDGQAAYATPDDGWILVSNSEAPAVDPAEAPARSASTSAAESVTRTGSSATRTSTARAVATPWGTWLSCEEVDTGRVWECDPRGRRRRWPARPWGCSSTRPRPWTAAGGGSTSPRTWATAASTASRPRRWPSLAHGKLEVAVVRRERRRDLARGARPGGQDHPTREQVPGATRFIRGEGIWFDSGTVYVATTADNRVHALRHAPAPHRRDLRRRRPASTRRSPAWTTSRSPVAGDLYVCEDNGPTSWTSA